MISVVQRVSKPSERLADREIRLGLEWSDPEGGEAGCLELA